MKALTDIVLIIGVIILTGCSYSQSNGAGASETSREFFLDRYTSYISDIQSLKFPRNIDEHYSKKLVSKIKENVKGDITPEDIGWEVQSSYMPVSSFGNSYFKLKSSDLACLTIIGSSFEGEPMYLNLMFVNQLEDEWRIDKFSGFVFTDGRKPEFPTLATCPEINS